MKGLEEGLEKNLSTFFDLEYPSYELIFSVADPNDPSLPLIQNLICKNPKVQAQLLVGDLQVGPNPKVNNMVRGYKAAHYNWILISDSNVRVSPDYLLLLARSFTHEVGVVTAVVAGCYPKGLGAWLEAVFLNTFYARWMMIADKFGSPVVVGKSMLFRKKDAERFGGVKTLARYLAEDYMAGKAMQYLGKKVVTLPIPIRQPIGKYTVKDFWSRHIRWGRIRKSQAPLAFSFEPFLSFWLSGLLGAYSVERLFSIPVAWTFSFHISIWFFSDLIMMKVVSDKVGLRAASVWFLREFLHLPLWIHISMGRNVKWRGRTLTLARGGILKA